MSDTFNVVDLSMFSAGDDLRTNPFQKKGNDERKDGTNSKAWKEAHNDPIRVPAGSVTRSRMKKFKEELNAMVRGVCE